MFQQQSRPVLCGRRARYTHFMKFFTLLIALLAAAPVAGPAAGQEKPVPKNEVRVQIPGCAYKRTFISSEAPAGELVGVIKEGRRFKMSASKELLADINKQTPSMIEITGRIRRADLDDTRGIPVGGGVRIGGGRPVASGGAIGRDPGYSEVLIDVEAFRLLPDTCPKR
jgi:hypothetical protein